MKTTIYIGAYSRCIVSPVPSGALIRTEVRRGEVWELWGLLEMTPDQAGALMFGIEQAVEATEVAADRQKATA